MADKFHKLEGVKFPVGSQTAQEIKSLCARYASHKKKVAFKLKQYTEAALAHENNPDDTSARKLAKKLANQYRFSFRGRLIAVITENKKLDWGKRRSLSQCFSLAKNLTAHKQSDEAVRVAFKPKANGGQRPVQDFGLQQRATQELAKTIIERRVHPQKWQYTFLGVNPSGLSDQYADYQQQVVNHSLINYQYCIDNPNNYVGYSADCWGLTASDGNSGYSAHSPTNDRGVITPTAALSSMPFTPTESMAALKHFYYVLGDKLWGPYGFYDAFNLTEGWVADSYLAIDQGPIICMIENHRTGLLWDLFMSAPEAQNGLDRLDFSY